MTECEKRPILLQADYGDDKMEASCCSSDDESFCSMDDASSLEDESLCYDTDNDETMSFMDDEENGNTSSSSTATEKEESSLSPSKAAALLPHIVHSLCRTQDQEDSLDHLDLSFPIPSDHPKGNDCISHLLQAMRCNTSVTKCSIGMLFFKSLSMEQRRALVDAVGDFSPSLQCLELDSVFAEFMYTCDCLRNWKRDHHYRHHQQYNPVENRTVEEIKITLIPSNVTEQVLGRLVMLTVANFSSLKRLSISFVGGDQPNAVLMRVALTALSHSRSLLDVKFDLGDQTIMEVGASRKNNILKLLKLRCCSNDGGEHGNNSLPPLDGPSYMALAQMLQVHSETLRGLVLDTAVDNNGALAMAQTLGRNNNLKALCLGTFDCQDKKRRDGLLSLVSQVLLCPQQQDQNQQEQGSSSSSSSLEYLSLVCQELDDEGVQQISKTLAQSNLRELMLYLDNEVEDAISSKGIAALAHVLQVNTSMEDFSLICNTLDDDGVHQLARGLKHDNRTLKNLKLECNRSFGVTSRGYQAIIHMLKLNTVLESIELSRCPKEDEDDEEDDEMELADEAVREECEAEIDCYLKLNQAGVRNLQLNIDTTPRQFLAKLVSHREDLNTTFYMLSANPSFVAIGTEKAY